MLDKYNMRGFKHFCRFDPGSKTHAAMHPFQPDPLGSNLFPRKCDRILDSDYTRILYWIESESKRTLHLDVVIIKLYVTWILYTLSGQKKGKREYLNEAETKEFTAKLNTYFEANVEIPRIKVGERQTIETLINEEALLFAKYLRNEKRDWIPRAEIVRA